MHNEDFIRQVDDHMHARAATCLPELYRRHSTDPHLTILTTAQKIGNPVPVVKTLKPWPIYQTHDLEEKYQQWQIELTQDR